MTPLLRHRQSVTVAEFCAATGDKPDTVRKWHRTGRLEARDLNAGTGKRPRLRIPARALRKRLREIERG